MESPIENYPFYTKSFTYNEEYYSVCMTPELYRSPDDEPMEGFEYVWKADRYKGLDFTGAYMVLINSSKHGTQSMKLEPDGKRWSADRRGTDPGLVDLLNEFIEEVQKITG